MKNNYELLLALAINGPEEEIKALLERLEKIMNAEGALIEKVQRLDRREFAYPHRHLTSAHYVNFVMTADPSAIVKLQQKLALVEEVTLQNYLKKEKVKTTDAPVQAKKTRKKETVAA
ncbi:MAG: 30S ribosomal protein S6 [Chthoniobacterales bacterium]|nr:30S ribosomal protein S6 [Chthoniobacterales bacterium]